MAKDLGNIERRERVTISLAGDCGDGIQLTGTQLTHISAIAENNLATFPDFSAEIIANNSIMLVDSLDK